MAQAWESSAPDENMKHEKRVWQSGQFAIAQTFSTVLQKAWLLPVEDMGLNVCSALPPPSCVNDASVLLEFIMRSVTCVEETTSMKVFELVAIWADTIAYWDYWEMEDHGVFNTIKEAVNFHQRFDFTGFFLKMLPSQSENDSQSSVIGRFSNFVTRAIAAYPSAIWRACSCIHTLVHAPNFSLGTEDARKNLAVSFAQAAFSHSKSVSASPAGIWKPLLLAISSCYICYPDAIEQVLCNQDGNGYAIWTSALAQVASTSFSPGLSSVSEIKLAVLTLATVIERMCAFSMGGTKLLQDCYASLMESCIHLKEVVEDGDNDDDDDGAEDLDDDDEEEEDTADDDEGSEDDVREETEEEFLERYALAAAGGAIEVVDEGDIHEETQDIELGSLDEVDIQQAVLSLMQNRPVLQAQTLSDSLVERITETFPEYEHLFQARRQA